MSPAFRWSEVTAVFGGTFDPPHLGHREAVRGLFEWPQIRRVLVLPSPAPPHKSSYASAEQRIEMARINFASHPGSPYPPEVELDLRELDRSRNGAPSYTFDTLIELRREIPSLAFVIGTDQLSKIHTWYRFPEILNLCHWIVLERKLNASGSGDLPSASDPLQAFRQWMSSGLLSPCGPAAWKTPSGTFLERVPTQAPEISSTSIRETLAKSGEPPANLLLPEVIDYLKTHRVYGTEARLPGSK